MHSRVAITEQISVNSRSYSETEADFPGDAKTGAPRLRPARGGRHPRRGLPTSAPAPGSCGPRAGPGERLSAVGRGPRGVDRSPAVPRDAAPRPPQAARGHQNPRTRPALPCRPRPPRSRALPGAGEAQRARRLTHSSEGSTSASRFREDLQQTTPPPPPQHRPTSSPGASAPPPRLPTGRRRP
ncbi:hypothetical protein AB1E18_005207 [Capra hircus]